MINLDLCKKDTISNLKKLLSNLDLEENEKIDFLKYFEKSKKSKKVFFIGGNQISGSLSPFMHNYSAFLENYNLDYFLLDMTKQNIGINNVLKFIEDNEEIVGANVTMPYKIEVYEILKSLGQLDESAKLVGAVNTISKNQNGKLIGYNTDIYGIINPIKEKLGEEIKKIKNGYVLGAGGASRAVVAAFINLGITNITIFNRGKENMINLKNHFNSDITKKIIGSDYSIKIVNYDIGYDKKSQLGKYIDTNSILVNTLPFGFKNHFSKYPMRESEFKQVLGNISLYFDVVYDLNEKNTPISSYLKENYPDKKLCNGIEMVVGQAKKGFEMWSGKEFQDKKIINILINN